MIVATGTGVIEVDGKATAVNVGAIMFELIDSARHRQLLAESFS